MKSLAALAAVAIALVQPAFAHCESIRVSLLYVANDIPDRLTSLIANGVTTAQYQYVRV